MQTNRRTFFRGLAAAGLAGAVHPARAEGPRHNILVIVADDQGLDLGCYGNRIVETPNLDRLAEEGVRFSHAFTSTASCSASRSVMLTGLYNHANGQYGHAHSIHNFHTHEHVRSLPRLLRDHGYYTGVVSKLHVKPPAAYPFEFQAENGSRDVAAMARKAGEMFRQARETKRPFYLHVGYHDPHRAGMGFANDRDWPSVKRAVYNPAQVEIPYYLSDRPEVRGELAEYYQAVSRLDQGVGMLLGELRRSGQEEETLVIYVSDNGRPFPGAKATLYEPGVRLPMIVRAPGLKRRGGVNHAMVNFVDLAPTCLEWAGAAGPNYPLHGRSVLSILEQETPAGWDHVFLSHTFHGVLDYYPSRGIRTRRFKYIRNLLPEMLYPLPSDQFASHTWQGILRRKDAMMGRRPVESFLKRPFEELYDLEADPNELRNLAGSAEFAGVLADCRAKVDQMEKETGDPWWEFQQQRKGMVTGA